MDNQIEKAAAVRLQPPSRFGGGRLPVGTGRPKGSQNKVTKTIREAVELAARQVTDKEGRKGLAYWLLERANGGVADRQIFAAMMAKALPLTVNANGTGGVTINLGWLSGRDIGGTLTVQPASKPLIEHDDKRTINPDASLEPIESQKNTAAETPIPADDRLPGGG